LFVFVRNIILKAGFLIQILKSLVMKLKSSKSSLVENVKSSMSSNKKTSAPQNVVSNQNIKGPQGPQGATGPQGPMGGATFGRWTGPQGPTGPYGYGVSVGGLYGNQPIKRVDPKDELMQRLCCVQQIENPDPSSLKLIFCEKPAEYFYSILLPSTGAYDIDNDREVPVIYRCFCHEHARTGHWKALEIEKDVFISSQLLEI